MNQILAITILVLVASCFAVAQTNTNNRTQQEIRRIISEVAESGLHGDKATAERLIADDYLYTGMNGGSVAKIEGIR